MKISYLKTAIGGLLDADRPVFVSGPPGVGKSDAIRQVAFERAMGLMDLRALLLDPVDLRGIPHVNGDGMAHWALPSFLPQVDRDGSRGILFLDELNAAPQSTQAACYQLVLDRALGEYRLPPGWKIIAAGNRDTDRAVANRMPTALANRFIHLEVEADPEDWTRWALKNDVPTEVIAFIRFRPELLHAFDPKAKERAFPSPRTWTFVGDIIKSGIDPAVEHAVYAGTIGEGPAAEFIGFLRIFRTLPNPDTVMMNPDTADVPTDPATLYALCGAIARKASPDNFERLTRYVRRLPGEYGVLTVRDAANLSPEVQQTRAFIGWASANADVLI